MSYLTRISVRVTGPGTPAHAVMPKGLDKPRTPATARMSATEPEGLEDQPQLKNEGEEQVAPLRRQETSEDDQLAFVRRQETAEEDETMAPMRRQAEEEEGAVQPLRRQAEEEADPIQAMRIQAQEEEEEVVQPLRRQVKEGEEEPIQAMRAITRQEEVPLEDTGQPVPPPTQESLEPGAVPVSQEFAGEEEPSALQALHRNFLPVSAQSPRQATEQHGAPEHPSANRPLPETFTPYPSFAPDWSDGMGTSNAPPPNLGSDDQRPNVVIDQVDVLIHETASPVDRSVSRRSRDRAMRARYLRRL